MASVGFEPIVWVLPHPGTNGQVSSWGAHLAGTAPPGIGWST
jgi:hypothetical protein